jgi:hypothetical protein
MSPDDAVREINRQIEVRPSMVMIAKAIMAASAGDSSSSDNLIDEVLGRNDARLVTPVPIYDSGDTLRICKGVATWISWTLAASEAIWGLIGTGVFFPSPEHSQPRIRTIGWTTAPPGGSGMSAGWQQFEARNISVPNRITRAPSYGANSSVLSDPDLYMATLSNLPIHQEVTNALREAVLCFRHELYSAAVAMLGKASEGAWIELGESLLQALDEEDTHHFENQRNVLNNSSAGTPQKIEAVTRIFARQDFLGWISETTGIRPKELGPVVQWSNVVRDARNTVHFGVAASTSNDYEKVAVLFLSAVSNLKVIYTLIACARTDGA